MYARSERGKTAVRSQRLARGNVAKSRSDAFAQKSRKSQPQHAEAASNNQTHAAAATPSTPPPALQSTNQLATKEETIQCPICYDDVVEAISCQEQHSICSTCFNRHVVAQSDETNVLGFEQLYMRDGAISCYFQPQGCKAAFYDAYFVARHVTEQTFQTYMASIKAAIGFHVRQEAKRELEDKRAAEAERAKAEVAQKHLVIERRRKEVIDTILTDHCEYCGLAMFDFDACFAVTCLCGRTMCAWCLKSFKTDQEAHRHVTQCPLNIAPGRELHGRFEMFEEGRRIRQIKALQAYIKTVDKDDVEPCLRALDADLACIKITKSDVLGDGPVVHAFYMPAAPPPAHTLATRLPPNHGLGMPPGGNPFLRRVTRDEVHAFAAIPARARIPQRSPEPSGQASLDVRLANSFMNYHIMPLS